MAIFASTTIPYSSANQALTIKALEKRHADMLAQQSKAQAPEIATPIQGIGHVVNQLADQMQVGRVEAQAAASREELAKIIQGIDPATGPNQQQLGAMSRLNPDMVDKYLEMQNQRRLAEARQTFEAGQQKERFAHETGRDTARTDEARIAAAEAADVAARAAQVKADEDRIKAAEEADRQAQAAQAKADEERIAAAEKAETEEKAKIATEERAAARAKETFKGDVGDQIHNLDVLKAKGQISDEQYNAQRDAILQKAAAPKIEPNVLKGRAEAEKAHTQSQIAVDDLKRARDAFMHPGGVYEGAMQNIAPGASTIPGAGYLLDKEKAQRTALVNNVLSRIATGTMAETLKGSSTNYEMQKFEKIYNDPAVSPKDKQIAFNNLIKVAEADLLTESEQVKAFGGTTKPLDTTTAKPGGGGGGQDAEARAWLADPKNANHPAREGVMKRLGGK